MSRLSVIKRGNGWPLNASEDSYLYEKTTDDTEVVAQLGASKGTADHQFKIYVSGIPAGVFDFQYLHPGRDSSDNYDKTRAVTAQPVNIYTEGDFVFEGTLDNGQSIVKGEPVQFESGTGKIQLQTSNPQCGWAAETKAASGADGKILVHWDPEHSVIVDEDVTVTAHQGTLTHTPIEIHLVEGTTGTGLGPKTVGKNNTTPAAGASYWNGTTGIKFNTTDAITAAKVRYRHA